VLGDAQSVVADPCVLHQVFDAGDGVRANAGRSQSGDTDVGGLRYQALLQGVFKRGIFPAGDAFQTFKARDNVASIRAEEKPAIAGFVQAVQWT
jgi:hypothetical protein